MAQYDVKRAPHPADPNRCQSRRGDSDQCMNLALPGSKYCPVHGGNKAAEVKAAEASTNYRLTIFKARVQEFATNPGVKGLREEIGITRLVLEEVLNNCNDHNDLLMSSSKISSLVRDINTLVGSAHKLESSMGLLLDKMAILQLGQEMVEIISSELVTVCTAVLAFVPEAQQEQVSDLLQNDFVDRIIARMQEAMAREGKPNSSRNG